MLTMNAENGPDVEHIMGQQLAGKTAFITGAGRGIGVGIAEVLAERGAAVVLSDIDQRSAHLAATRINKVGRKAFATCGDVTNIGSMSAAVKAAIKFTGQIDICVANAGVIGARDYLERTTYTDADWEMTHNVNVRGMVNTADAISPHMKSRRYGKIVNIASHGGRKPRGPGKFGDALIPYQVSKAATIQWTHLLATMLGPYNVNVNAVCPGMLWTSMWQKIAINLKKTNPELSAMSPREIFDQIIQDRMLLQREQTPKDVGRAVAFLASEDASEITGQALNVNGGALVD